MSNASPIEVKEWLEWAGAKLLAMHISSPKPKEFRSFWPDYADEAHSAYGYTGERLRPAQPRAVEIELMDKLLLFPGLIEDIQIRRIVNARALVSPVANRYLYSWHKLGFMLNTSPRRVVRLHAKGLITIADKLPPEKVDAVRRLLPSSRT